MNHNKKGITPVIAIIILLIIAVAVVGLAYGFITGFIGTVTGKAAIISGASSCSNGRVSIIIQNAGTGAIDLDTGVGGDVTVVRVTGGPVGKPPLWTSLGTSGTSIDPTEQGTIVEDAASGGPPTTNEPCGTGICTYDVDVGGVVFSTTATC